MNEKQAKRLRRAERNREVVPPDGRHWCVIHHDIYRRLVEAGMIKDVHGE